MMSRAEMVFFTIIFSNLATIIVVITTGLTDIDLTNELLLVPMLILILCQRAPTPVRDWLNKKWGES